MKWVTWEQVTQGYYWVTEKCLRVVANTASIDDVVFDQVQLRNQQLTEVVVVLLLMVVLRVVSPMMASSGPDGW